MLAPSTGVGLRRPEAIWALVKNWWPGTPLRKLRRHPKVWRLVGVGGPPWRLLPWRSSSQERPPSPRVWKNGRRSWHRSWRPPPPPPRRSRSPKRATDCPRTGSPSLGGDQQPKLPREGVVGGSIRSLPQALLRISTTTIPPRIPSRVRPPRVGPRGACIPISITHSATRQSDSH